MKKLFLITGYLSLILIYVNINRYLEKGYLRTRWGTFSGDNARHALIGFILLYLLFGLYALWETYKFIKARYFTNKEISILSKKRF